MSFELIHYRNSEKILKKKGMLDDMTKTLEYIDSALQGAYPFGSLLKQSLAETGWREDGTLNILPDRKYSYRGFKKGIAMDGSLTVFEYAHEALFRMQLGFAYKKVDVGILLVNNIRGPKSPFGTTRELIESEIEMLEPVITLPVAVALFDLV